MANVELFPFSALMTSQVTMCRLLQFLFGTLRVNILRLLKSSGWICLFAQMTNKQQSARIIWIKLFAVNFLQDFFFTIEKSRKENPQKLTQLSSRSHPRHLVGKRTAQKDTIIDITSDTQVNSNFPYRWSPARLTFNNYFYLFLYLYIT